MPRLLGLQGDAEGRVGCSECMKRWKDLPDRPYLFEVPDKSVAKYELRGQAGNYERREASPTRPRWEPAPADGEVACIGCARSDHMYRKFSLADGSETFAESYGAKIPRP